MLESILANKDGTLLEVILIVLVTITRVGLGLVV